MTSKKFNLQNFNKEFIFKRDKQEAKYKIEEENILNELNEETNIHTKSLYNLSILEIALGIKNTWFDILDDILFTKNIKLIFFTKNNRLFFIGISIIFMSIILYICNSFLE